MSAFLPPPLSLRTSNALAFPPPTRRSPPRPFRPPLRALLHDPVDPDKSVTQQRIHLRTEQLSAFFDASDSNFQTCLSSAARLALANFATELAELLTSFRRAIGLDPPLRFSPPECLNLRLSNEAVENREREREHLQGTVSASPFVRFVYHFTCTILDVRYEARPIARFWVLETVARMPYFAYTSCLHLFATLGWYRSPTLMNMHHAEELNEAYHLAVMESLGGDRRWGDRFFAFHASLLYYWLLVVLFLISPSESYRFSQLIEGHAVDTYSEFIEANEQVLRSLPAPEVAHEYYENFLYYFYEFQLTEKKQPDENSRRPQISSLYDVFQNILLDEREHTRTMVACTNYIENDDPIWYNGKRVSGRSRRHTSIPPKKREQYWKKWTELQEKDADK